jgi:hypothetical protein
MIPTTERMRDLLVIAWICALSLMLIYEAFRDRRKK